VFLVKIFSKVTRTVIVVQCLVSVLILFTDCEHKL